MNNEFAILAILSFVGPMVGAMVGAFLRTHLDTVARKRREKENV